MNSPEKPAPTTTASSASVGRLIVTSPAGGRTRLGAAPGEPGVSQHAVEVGSRLRVLLVLEVLEHEVAVRAHLVEAAREGDLVEHALAERHLFRADGQLRDVADVLDVGADDPAAAEVEEPVRQRAVVVQLVERADEVNRVGVEAERRRADRLED